MERKCMDSNKAHNLEEEKGFLLLKLNVVLRSRDLQGMTRKPLNILLKDAKGHDLVVFFKDFLNKIKAILFKTKNTLEAMFTRFGIEWHLLTI